VEEEETEELREGDDACLIVKWIGVEDREEGRDEGLLIVSYSPPVTHALEAAKDSVIQRLDRSNIQIWKQESWNSRRWENNSKQYQM
jgi:hypothetical protein